MPVAVLGTLEMLGEDLVIRASASGRFTLALDDREIGSGETLEQAKSKARTELNKRRVKVAVPFLLEDGRRAVATQRHAGNRTVLYEIDGQKDSLPGYGTGSKVFKAETPPETIARLADLRQQARDAEFGQREIEKEWGVDIGKAVDRAVAEALEAASTEGGS